MKKQVIFAGFLALALTALQAQNVVLTNTLGGNTDNSGTQDFLRFKDDLSKKQAAFGDRIQLDVASENIDSRIRFNIRQKYSNDTLGDWEIAPQAYVNFRPVKGLNFIGGNKFFYRWIIQGAYFLATDDCLTHGKLADDNGAGFVGDFAGDGFGIKAAAAVGSEADLDLNFGLEFALNDLFAVGASAQDVTEDSVTLGGYISFKGVENLTVNAGYTYNTNDTGYFDATEHLIQASVGYQFEKLYLSADAALGLNDRYYNTKSEKFESRKGSGVPVYGQIRAVYKVNETLDLAGWIRVNKTLADKGHNSGDLTTLTVYPFFNFRTSVGTFRSGARVFFNQYDGFAGFNIPISWQAKLKIK